MNKGRSKRPLAIAGAVATVPLVLWFSGWAAESLYLTYILNGRINNFDTSDAFGEELLYPFIALPLLFVCQLLWWRSYRATGVGRVYQPKANRAQIGQNTHRQPGKPRIKGLESGTIVVEHKV